LGKNNDGAAAIETRTSPNVDSSKRATMTPEMLPTDTSTEALTAWRAWAYTDAGLRALTGRDVWPGEPQRARCAHEHDAPAPACHCGWYGAKRLATGLSWTRAYWDVRKGHTAVVGRVALWGRVMEHEHGYRAEYAYPQALYVVGAERAARHLERLYHVEVYRCTWQDLERLAIEDLASSPPPRLPRRTLVWLAVVPSLLQGGLAFAVSEMAAGLSRTLDWVAAPVAGWVLLWVAAVSLVPDPWEYERRLVKRSRARSARRPAPAADGVPGLADLRHTRQ
jgi:hypothetical protein